MRLDVLDHGYILLVEHWGSDERIIEAARMSTSKGFLGWGPQVQCQYCGASIEEIHKAPSTQECGASGGGHNVGAYGPPGDEKLLAYLYRHKHTTPFEMAGVTIEVMAPIFVFREWHRHRTQSYSEVSARYVPLPDVNYVPTIERLLQRGDDNRQAQGTGETLTEERARTFVELLEQRYLGAQLLYQEALKAGVPKELARLCLPVGRYSKMRASANLWNWLRFLTLRTAPNAQYEIRQYAIALAGVLEQIYPRTMALWAQHK